MELNRKSTGGDNENFAPIENLPEEEVEARLVMVADLGIQEGMIWNKEQKPDAQQISLGFEVIGKTVTLTDKDGVEEEKARVLWTSPINIYQNLTEKGKELPLYKVFDKTAQAGEVALWGEQLGKPCNLDIVHTKGKGENSDKVYDNIGNVLAIPAKYQADVGDATVEFGIGNAEDEDNAVNKALYGLAKWVFDRRIKEEQTTAPSAGDMAESALQEGFDDDIPF